MKKRKDGLCQILRRVLCMLMVCTLISIDPLGVDTVYARTKVEFDPVLSGSWVAGPVEDDNYTGIRYMYINAVEEGAKVRKLRSSDPRVATVSATSFGLCIQYGLHTGSTTISCVVRGVRLSHRFTVRYTCPVSSFKVDGKNVLSTLKKKNVYVTSKTLTQKNVVIKAKKGWVITHISNTKAHRNASREVKNKTSITTKITTRYPYDGVCVKLRNKKTGEEQTVKYRKRYNLSDSMAG